MSGVLHGVVASLKAAAAAATDAFFEYVTLLLNTSATNGAQNNTFLDSSTNNFSITRNGDTTQGSFNPYMPSGYWSGFFDGTDDRLTVADNAALRPGTGNFTIEAWVFRTASGVAHTIYAKGAASTGFVFQITSGNLLRFTDTTTNIDSTGTVAANTWVHVAVVREGTGTNQLKLYISGTNDGQGTVSTNFNQTEELRIGENRGATEDFSGYISNVRFATTAVYTANFTPPTTPLTAIANTSLLCLQDNRFIDNSTNAFAITVNGDTRISKFAPFNIPASYSTASYGGSGYFDGNGDELNAGSNAAFSFGTGAYTVECWVFLTAAVSATHQPFFVVNHTTNGFAFWNENGTGQLQIASSGVGGVVTSTTTLTANIWNHVVAVRSGTGANQTAIFVNGSRVANGTDATNWTVTGPLKVGGITLATYYINGYVSNVRVVKGTAVYDPTQTTLTVPTAPLTAITNTSLLLNFTNAGIYDAATINDGQTVGNAQVSTTQAKWSPTSMAFDGTGDYVVSPSSISFGYGTGDFTIEFWLYLNSASADQTIVSNLTSVSSTNPHLYLLGAGGTIRYYTAGADRITGSALSTGQWYHIAVAKASGSTRLFINGTQSGSTYTDGNNYGTSAPLGVGTYWSAGAPVTTSTLNGYIQDLRITNGYARYTANFTAPTAAFPTL
jgi:hypothetical protein